jgi:hypothetical protein
VTSGAVTAASTLRLSHEEHCPPIDPGRRQRRKSARGSFVNTRAGCAVVTTRRMGYMSGVRRVLGALLLAVGRDPGVTLVETDRWTLAEELWSFGEDSLYPVALQLSDEDMVAPVARFRWTPLEGKSPFQWRGGCAGGGCSDRGQATAPRSETTPATS